MSDDDLTVHGDEGVSGSSVQRVAPHEPPVQGRFAAEPTFGDLADDLGEVLANAASKTFKKRRSYVGAEEVCGDSMEGRWCQRDIPFGAAYDVEHRRATGIELNRTQRMVGASAKLQVRHDSLAGRGLHPSN
jgi:hypothetical protein